MLHVLELALVLLVYKYKYKYEHKHYLVYVCAIACTKAEIITLSILSVHMISCS